MLSVVLYFVFIYVLLVVCSCFNPFNRSVFLYFGFILYVLLVWHIGSKTQKNAEHAYSHSPPPHACSTPPHMHVPHPLRASTPPPNMHVHHPTACICPTTPHAYPSHSSHAYQRRREGESEREEREREKQKERDRETGATGAMRQVPCDRCNATGAMGRPGSSIAILAQASLVYIYRSSIILSFVEDGVG